MPFCLLLLELGCFLLKLEWTGSSLISWTVSNHEFGKNETENYCSDIFAKTLDILYKNCRNRVDPFEPSECSTNLNAAKVALEKTNENEKAIMEEKYKSQDFERNITLVCLK